MSRPQIRTSHSSAWRHALQALIYPLLLTATYALSGCGESSTSADVANSGQQQQTQQQKSSGSQANYPEIKTIVLDILHSKEGMTTLKDTMSSPEFKRATAITNNDIQAAVEKTLQQGQNKHFLAEAMKDTQFAAALVTAAREQTLALQKQLMHDPTYQKDLLTLMQAPEAQQSQLELLKSPEYRKEVMKIMSEALQEPTFRLLFMDSMKEAIKTAGGGQKEQMGKSQSTAQGSKGKTPESSKDQEKGESGGGSGEEGGGDENGSSGG